MNIEEYLSSPPSKSEWAILKDHIKDEHAFKFIHDLCSIANWIDDVVDNDNDLGAVDRLNTASRVSEIIVFDLPLNPFYQANSFILSTMIRQYIANWKVATSIELRSREALIINAMKKGGQTEFEFNTDQIKNDLIVAYGLKEDICNIACVVVDLLEGNEARDKFMSEWLLKAKSIDSFDDYYAKVTAKDRPTKGKGDK